MLNNINSTDNIVLLSSYKKIIIINKRYLPRAEKDFLSLHLEKFDFLVS
jgi:hypothetical protein